MTLAINKMDRHGDINRMPAKENKGDAILVTKGLPERQSISFIKVSEQMHSNVFKRRLAFSFTVTILA